MIGLTRRQLEMAQMIQECLDNGHSVSVKEIGEEFELSIAWVHELLCKLRDCGIIVWLPYHQRSIEMLVRVPEVQEYEFRLAPDGQTGLTATPLDPPLSPSILAQLIEIFRQLDRIEWSASP